MQNFISVSITAYKTFLDQLLLLNVQAQAIPAGLWNHL